SGKILEVLPRKQRVLIEGVLIIKKHMRKSQDNRQGKIAEREGPIHISNVKLVERNEKPAKEKKKKESTKAKTSKAQMENELYRDYKERVMQALSERQK